MCAHARVRECVYPSHFLFLFCFDCTSLSPSLSPTYLYISQSIFSLSLSIAYLFLLFSVCNRHLTSFLPDVHVVPSHHLLSALCPPALAPLIRIALVTNSLSRNYPPPLYWSSSLGPAVVPACLISSAPPVHIVAERSYSMCNMSPRTVCANLDLACSPRLLSLLLPRPILLHPLALCFFPLSLAQ